MDRVLRHCHSELAVGARLRQAAAGRQHILWEEAAAAVHLTEELAEGPWRLYEGVCVDGKVGWKQKNRQPTIRM